MTVIPDTFGQLSPLQRALLGLKEARAQLDTLRRAQNEPIAIVGMGCRYPGAPDVGAYWRMLVEGRCAIADIPADRWDADAYYDPDLGPGTMNTRRGGFIEGIDLFDPGFFDLSLAEVRGMDPQQRILLECTWRALEHAGIAPETLRGSATGVFIGISTFDYSKLLTEAPGRAGTGIVHSIAANRISYLFDLRGPSFAVDTACSSSLLATHLAMRSLRQRECDLAIVGGVNAMLAPDATVGFAQAGMLSPDGLCKSFDARADGYVRGEGCGVVLLKRRSDAERDRDRVFAFLRGSATNQDGRSNGLTAPNGPAQVAVIRKALTTAGVDPAVVGYVEAHGTGTSLGDAVEAQALADVFGEGRDPDKPCVVGCVKPNIGHLEAGAGIAAIIKVTLILHHGFIPPLPHLQDLNPAIAPDGPLSFPRALRPWPRGEGPRIAGVSGFGFGGANVHLVMEEPPVGKATKATRRRWQIVVVSGRTERAAASLAGVYAADLASAREEELADVALTASHGRTQFAHRIAAVADGLDDLRATLAAVAQGTPNDAHRGIVPRGATVRVALVLPGASPDGYAAQLSETEGVFREALSRAVEACHAFGLDPKVALPPGARRTDAEETLARFVAEYAFGALWMSWLTPASIVGHGSGAWVAPCLAGTLSLPTAVQLAGGRPLREFVAHEPARRLLLGASVFEPRSVVRSDELLRACQAAAGAIAPPTSFRESCEVAVDLGGEARSVTDKVILRVAGDRDVERALLEALAEVYVRGGAIDWLAVDSGRSRRRDVPFHPFDRRRCWLDPGDVAPRAPRTRARAYQMLGRSSARSGAEDHDESK